MDETQLKRKYENWIEFNEGVPILSPRGRHVLNTDDFDEFSELRLVPQSRLPVVELEGESDECTIVVEGATRIDFKNEVKRRVRVDLRNQVLSSNVPRTVVITDGRLSSLEIVDGNVTANGRMETKELILWIDQSIDFDCEELNLRRNDLLISVSHRVKIDRVCDGRSIEEDPLIINFRRPDGSADVITSIGELKSEACINLLNVGLSVTTNSANMKISGIGFLHLPRGANLNSVSIESSQVSLRLDEDSELRGFSGSCLIEYASNATIEAPPEDFFDFVGMKQSRNGSILGLTLRGVRIVPGHAGRTRLSELSDVRVFEPFINKSDYLPEWKDIGFSLAGLRKKAKSKPELQKKVSSLIDRAYFYKELDALVVEKCSSGSIRSRSAWDRIRAQQLTSGRVERSMYGIFRLVGYGQRPVPPLLTWVTVALLTAVSAVLLGADVHFLSKDFVIVFTHFLLTPFVLFKFAADGQIPGQDIVSGTSQLDRHILILLQVLIVASFVFFVTALRNYMRSSA